MGDRPIKKWRISNIEGCIWDNTKKVNGTELNYKTVTISRSYRKKEENIWRSETINNIRRLDIPKLKAILSKIEDYLYFEAFKEKDNSEE